MIDIVLRRCLVALLIMVWFPASQALGQYSVLSPAERQLFDACRPEITAVRDSLGGASSSIPIEEAAFASSTAASVMQETTVAASQARLTGILANDPNNHVLPCMLRARIRQLSGGGPAHPSAPTPRPNIAAKVAPSSAQQARDQAAKNHADALAYYQSKPHSPQFAAARADALANCRGPLKEWEATNSLSLADNILMIEGLDLADDSMSMTAAGLTSHVAMLKSRIAAGSVASDSLAAHRAAICLFERRIAQLEGKTKLADKGTAVPPLRPTITQEAHNPAGEATDCVRVIGKGDFEAEHVSTTQKAVFRNTCPHPVEVTWCTETSDCRPGYTNLFTVPARKDRGFSYEPSVRGSKVEYAACYNGFVPHQGELSKKLTHACK